MKKIFADKKDCFGCGSCFTVCPAKAIAMKEDEEGFFYPMIDNQLCTDCGACKKICPKEKILPQSESRFYAVRCNDMELLYKSTSGGAFSLIAEEIISEGGLICGACFDKDFQVRHVLSKEIAPMRKSKYVQSNAWHCFIEVKNALMDGKKVLFTGTPCQCHAMSLYCGDKYRGKLVTAALICIGVLSPGLWKDYVSWLSYEAPLERYDFRDKRRLNNAHTIVYTVGGTETENLWGKDRFCQMYSSGLTYRPSCYACPYCSPDHDFDFILGDFWGIGKSCPDLSDGKGTSLVITHGIFAEALIERITSKAIVVQKEREESLQPALVAPAKENILRKFLFKDFAKKNENGHCDIPLILKKYGRV